MTSGWKCKLHVTGVEPNTRAFYVPGCCTCERKKAAGLITGEEGPPQTRTEMARAQRDARLASPMRTQRQRRSRASASATAPQGR